MSDDMFLTSKWEEDSDGRIFVAPTALIEEGASLQNGIKVWHFTQIRSGASIGRNVTIGKGCFIDEDVEIGEGSKIQNGSEIYAPSAIGDGVFIGPHVILTNDLRPRAIRKDGAVLGPRDWTAIGCNIDRGASIGAGSVIVCTSVGAWALVGAGSVVTEPVLPHALVVGNPARQIGWVCFCGVRVYGACEECGWELP